MVAFTCLLLSQEKTCSWRTLRFRRAITGVSMPLQSVARRSTPGGTLLKGDCCRPVPAGSTFVADDEACCPPLLLGTTIGPKPGRTHFRFLRIHLFALFAESGMLGNNLIPPPSGLAFSSQALLPSPTKA